MPVRDTVPAGAPTWIDLATSDQTASIAFYTALLGWECEKPNPELGGYTNFTLAGERVAGCVPAMPGMPDTWGVYLATEDAEQTCAAVLAAGGAVHAPPMAVHDLGTMAVVADPTGASIGLWQPGTHRGLLTTGEPGHAGWFELQTAGYDATLAFGRDVFGWQTSSMADAPDFRYSTGSVAGAEVVGIMSAGQTRPEGPTGATAPQWSVYLQVQDADAAAAKAGQLGASIVQEATDTPYGRLVVLSDPTGALVKLVG